MDPKKMEQLVAGLYGEMWSGEPAISTDVKEEMRSVRPIGAVDLPHQFKGTPEEEAGDWLALLEAFYAQYYAKSDRLQKMTAFFKFHLTGKALAWYNRQRFSDVGYATVKIEFLRSFISDAERSRLVLESTQMEANESLPDFMLRASLVYDRLNLAPDVRRSRFRAALPRNCPRNYQKAKRLFETHDEARKPQWRSPPSYDSDKGDGSGGSESDSEDDAPQGFTCVSDVHPHKDSRPDSDPWYVKRHPVEVLQRPARHVSYKQKFLKMRVAGFKFKCILATGAQMSLITTETFNKIKSNADFKEWRSSKPMEDVSFPGDNRKTKVETRLQLSYKIDDVEYVGYFLVLQKLIFPVILGNDFASTYGVSIFFRRDGIVYEMAYGPAREP